MTGGAPLNFDDLFLSKQKLSGVPMTLSQQCKLNVILAVNLIHLFLLSDTFLCLKKARFSAFLCLASFCAYRLYEIGPRLDWSCGSGGSTIVWIPAPPKVIHKFTRSSWPSRLEHGGSGCGFKSWSWQLCPWPWAWSFTYCFSLPSGVKVPAEGRDWLCFVCTSLRSAAALFFKIKIETSLCLYLLGLFAE